MKYDHVTIPQKLFDIEFQQLLEKRIKSNIENILPSFFSVMASSCVQFRPLHARTRIELRGSCCVAPFVILHYSSDNLIFFPATRITARGLREHLCLLLSNCRETQSYETDNPSPQLSK